MSIVRLMEHANARVLVTRSAATELRAAIEAALQKDARTIEFDFGGIRVLAPSFIDQLLIIVEQVEAAMAPVGNAKVTLRSCPAGMREKLAAIGRAHDADVIEQDDQTWVLRRSA